MLPKKQFGILEIWAIKVALSQRGLVGAMKQSVGNVNRLKKDLSSVDLAQRRLYHRSGNQHSGTLSHQASCVSCVGFGSHFFPVTLNTPMRDFDASRNCGVSYWSKMDGKRLVEHLKEAYEDPGVKELFLAQVPLHVYGGSCQVAVVLCFEQDVTENDTYVELKNADSIYGL